MKYDSIRAFQKHLLSAAPLHFSSAYLVLSSEQFLLKEALKEIISALGDALATVYPREGELMTELSSLSLFEKRKLVIVEEADKIAKKEQELLIQWLKRPPSGCYLVLLSEGLRKGSLLYKAIEKQGIILDVPEAKPWQKEKEAVLWVQEKADLLKKRIDEKASKLLVEFVGSDKTALFSELEKLALYTGNNERIQAEDVSVLCRVVPKENIFKLSEAIFLRDGKKAVSLIVSLQHEGVQPLAILRLLRQQFEVDLQVALLARSRNVEEITNLYPYMKGFILEQHKKQAETYGISSFKKGLMAIDKAEYRIKSVPVEPDILIGTLIAELVIN